MELKRIFPHHRCGREAAKARKLQTRPANRRIGPAIRWYERNVERKSNCAPMRLGDILCAMPYAEFRMDARKNEVPEDAIAERKPWRAPRVVVSEIRHSENNPGSGSDGVGRVS
ncbi:MAG: hypothetical protein JSR60_19810 [Proteobacteria bacterium]|nr:hypothetical protein [Pseudomonadota bacterium]